MIKWWLHQLVWCYELPSSPPADAPGWAALGGQIAICGRVVPENRAVLTVCVSSDVQEEGLMVSRQPRVESTLFRPPRKRLFFRFPWEKGNSNVSKYCPPPNWDGSDIEQPAWPGTVNAGQRTDAAHTQVLLLTLLATLVFRTSGQNNDASASQTQEISSVATRMFGDWGSGSDEVSQRTRCHTTAFSFLNTRFVKL